MMLVRKISHLMVTPAGAEVKACSVKCLSGKVKWIPESNLISVFVEVVDEGESSDRLFDFLHLDGMRFDLEIHGQPESNLGQAGVVSFKDCIREKFEGRGSLIYPHGPATALYYVRASGQFVRNDNSKVG